MTSTTFFEAFLQMGPVYIAVIIGQLLAKVFIREAIDPHCVRRLLGTAVDAFAAIPPERLDILITEAAQAARRGWRGIVMFLHSAFWFATSMAVTFAYMDVKPALPYRWWIGMGLGAVVVSLGTWLNQCVERAFILSELKRRVLVSEKPRAQSNVE